MSSTGYLLPTANETQMETRWKYGLSTKKASSKPQALELFTRAQLSCEAAMPVLASGAAVRSPRVFGGQGFLVNERRQRH